MAKDNEKELLDVDYENFIHYNVELERALIGAILMEKGAIDKIYPLLEAEMFYAPKNQLIYKTIRWMYEKHQECDLYTVAHFIYNRGAKKWQDISPDETCPLYLTQCERVVCSTAHMEKHALIIRELYVNRLLLQIKMEAGTNNTLDGAIEIKNKLDKAFKVGKTDTWLTIEEVVTTRLIPHMDSVKNKDTYGSPTGLRTLDAYSPVESGDYIILAARPSVGKTAFAMGIARTIAKSGTAVGIISLETRSERLGSRIISGESQLEYWKIWKNKMFSDEEQVFYKSIDRLINTPIFINDQPAMSSMDIRIATSRLKAKLKPGQQLVIIIDYLQLVTPDEKNKQRHLEVGEISRTCKLLTLEEKDVAVIALAQIGRAAEMDGDKKPRSRHLKESGNLEQDADKIWLLHRDRDKENELKAQGYTDDFDASVIIDKNKDGWTGEINIRFKPEQMTFYESSYIPAEPAYTPAKAIANNFDEGFEQSEIF